MGTAGDVVFNYVRMVSIVVTGTDVRECFLTGNSNINQTCYEVNLLSTFASENLLSRMRVLNYWLMQATNNTKFLPMPALKNVRAIM